MAISSEVSRMSPVTGNGVTTAFTYTFRIFSESDLLVTLRHVSTGAETTQTLTTHYTVTGVGSTGGGTVVFVSAPSASYQVFIRRVRELTQTADIRNQSSFYPETHEDVFDKLTMQDQQQQDELDRSVKLKETITTSQFDPTLPTDIVGKANAIPTLNDDGDGFDLAENWPTVTEVQNAQDYATQAAASAATAAAAAASTTAMLFQDVVYLTSADSPYTVNSAESGRLFVADTTGGDITINLPQISSVTCPFNLGFKHQTQGGTNAVTIARNGTDTIDGATSVTLSEANQALLLLADTDKSPDQWTSLEFGANATLSNLGETAINVDLQFTRNGNSYIYTEPKTSGTSQSITVTSGWGDGGTANSGQVYVQSGDPDPTGLSGDVFINSGSTSGVGVSGGVQVGTGGAQDGWTGNVDIYTGEVNGTGTFSGSVTVETGDCSNGTPGTIFLSPGENLAAPGTFGKIKFINAGEGTAGDVWTSTDTGGTGSWQAAPTRAAFNYTLSSSCGSYATSSTSYADITNLSVSITTTGRPVCIMTVHDGTAADGYFARLSGATGFRLKAVRGATDLGEHISQGATGTAILELPSFRYVDFPAAGTYTYKLQMKSNTGGANVNAINLKLLVYEL